MWTAEFMNLPARLFGDSSESMWPRLALRSAVLLGFWAIVHFTTARLLRRLHELEAYLRICSWCRKVNDRGEWRCFEDYFGARFNTETSHGVCPACARQQLAKHCVAVRPQAESAPNP